MKMENERIEAEKQRVIWDEYIHCFVLLCSSCVFWLLSDQEKLLFGILVVVLIFLFQVKEEALQLATVFETVGAFKVKRKGGKGKQIFGS